MATRCCRYGDTDRRKLEGDDTGEVNGRGGGWRVIQGVSKGQTQTDLSEYGDLASFSHPLDIHLITKTIQGSLTLP
ncbi:unnamed protein product [Litomosoides sigmodontis]|uniref:Uncharacterized protein n=1 Tax=Litomosoides sigmodontis TaxID=42156 RepID=A0A3P6THM0_LITSI|nr:unnamed protein product [Litomosoides sigmodontis]